MYTIPSHHLATLHIYHWLQIYKVAISYLDKYIICFLVVDIHNPVVIFLKTKTTLAKRP